MRIALVADVFPPLRSSGAVQLRDLATEFVRQGYKVTVMVATPGLDVISKVDILDGVEVLRLRTLPTRDRGYIWRTLAEFLMPFWMLKGLKQSSLSQRLFDAVVWYSPTIFLGPFVKMLKRRSQCSTYLIIRDIFPEWAWDMGLIRNKFLYCGFKMVANYGYAQADVVGIQTRGNRIYFDCWQKRYPNGRVEVLHNWLSKAANIGSSIQISQTKLSGRRIFVYAGNMGVAQNTELFLKLAERLKDRQEFGFLFVGRGSESTILSNKYGALDNVLFFDEIDSAEIPGLYEQCHVGLVALDARHKSHNIPGKFLSYMHAGLPVLACVNAGNDLVRLIEEWQVGTVVDEEQLELLQAAELKVILASENDLAISIRCRELAHEMFAAESAVNQIVKALEETRCQQTATTAMQ